MQKANLGLKKNSNLKKVNKVGKISGVGKNQSGRVKLIKSCL